jgi:hypothetical protein
VIEIRDAASSWLEAEKVCSGNGDTKNESLYREKGRKSYPYVFVISSYNVGLARLPHASRPNSLRGRIGIPFRELLPKVVPLNVRCCRILLQMIMRSFHYDIFVHWFHAAKMVPECPFCKASTRHYQVQSSFNVCLFNLPKCHSVAIQKLSCWQKSLVILATESPSGSTDPFATSAVLSLQARVAGTEIPRLFIAP